MHALCRVGDIKMRVRVSWLLAVSVLVFLVALSCCLSVRGEGEVFQDVRRVRIPYRLSDEERAFRTKRSSDDSSNDNQNGSNEQELEDSELDEDQESSELDDDQESSEDQESSQSQSDSSTGPRCPRDEQLELPRSKIGVVVNGKCIKGLFQGKLIVIIHAVFGLSHMCMMSAVTCNTM